MKQRHRKAHVVRRQEMDRLMRLIVERSVVRTMQGHIDKMTFQVFQGDAESRAKMLSLIAAEFAKSLQQLNLSLAAMAEAAKHFPKTYWHPGTESA